MRRFDFLQSPHQAVEFGVADDRRVQSIVLVIVAMQLFAQFLQLLKLN